MIHPTFMKLGEAEKVLASVREDGYPPTNPIVLLRAALTLRWEHRTQDSREVLAWLEHVDRANSGRMPHEQDVAASSPTKRAGPADERGAAGAMAAT